MSRLRRWPLHPQPGPLESLSSWLRRIAGLYDITATDLLTRSLGLVDVAVPDDLDHDPPRAMLIALADRTGVEISRLRTMTRAGWEPWLFDISSLPPQDAQSAFDAYVRDNSVLFAPGEAGRNQASGRRPWAGPWLPDRPLRRACRSCVADPARGAALGWQLPLVTGCTEHGCRLEAATHVEWVVTWGRQAPGPDPLEEPLATVDRYTYQGLATGRVVLPGRSVHAGVWFRMLRSMLDEVSLASGTRNKRARVTLERIWQAADRPPRAGLKVWRPYEQLPPDIQEMLLHAVGTALRLAAAGTITARGRLASALQPSPDRYVYDGDRPHWRSWQEAAGRWETVLVPARTDRDAARRLLVLLTQNSPALIWFEEERAFLLGVGIPADFLPSARELGRLDLI